MRLAHLVKPVVVPPQSDLRIAQPVTFESMRRARAFAAAKTARGAEAPRRRVDVELFAAHFPEDHPMVPEDFTRTADLDRSVLDFGKFRKPNRLPLVRDMLDRLYEASSADYFIYSNVDIAVMPNFYTSVAALIAKGRDALVINRRTISTKYSQPEELPLMWSELGKKHPGRDCFVWARSAYPGFKLENVCIGTGGIGKVMLVNQLCHAKHFEELTDAHLTFHLGDGRAWKDNKKDDYRAFNMQELAKVVTHYRENNLLPDHPALAFVERKGI